jgi:hypothetical protein
MMKQKKIRKGFIPDDILNKEHDPKDFIEVNIHTDIRKIRENLKRKKKGRK